MAHYTDEEIAIAKSVDLVGVANALGYTPKRIGSYYTLKEMDSIRIYNHKTWYRWSRQYESEGRDGTQIDFLMHFGGYDFAEAVEWLLDFAGYKKLTEGTKKPLKNQAPKKEEKEKKKFILPIPARNNTYLYSYLINERGISGETVDKFVDKGLILESGDTVMSVTSAYVSEFNSEINSLATEHIGYDTGEIVYVDYEGTGPGISNYYDIIGVYMVKHGVGDTATIINGTTRTWIKQVFDDMCTYTLTSGTETYTDEDGNTETKSVLYVNVVLKNFNQMKDIYNFDENQVELLELVMGSGNFTLSGYVGGEAELSSKLTNAEINEIMEHITDVNQQFVCRYALNRVGYPYSQAYRDSGNYYDCSSLAYYSWKAANIDISYGGATSAAAEAQGLEEAGKTVSYESMQPGDLIFYSYCRNGRYKNISHVAIYIGNGKVVEAKSEQYGVVYGDIPSPASIVLIGRPQ